MASLFALSSPLSFADRLAASGTFDTLFRDGMKLVEDTAAYLDGDGRDQSRHLGRVAALAYASESMRLTTRLMQVASWLLLQRAVNEGEMSADEAAADKGRTRAAWQDVASPAPDAEKLPPALLSLIEASFDLQRRIQRLDTMICAVPAVAPNALEAQRTLLQQAFAGR